MEATEFINALKVEFDRRRRKNPSYSLRAYARSLAVDQSLLSKVLAEKRTPTPAFIEKISAELGLRKMPSILEQDYSSLTEGYLDLVGDWIHFAILEYLKTKEASSKPEVIAKHFGLHPVQIDLSLKLLIKLGFLKQEDQTYILVKPNNSWASSINTSAARKSLQKQLHEKALQSLDIDEFKQRDHSSLTVAISPEHLPEIRSKITAMRREIDQFIEEKLRSDAKDATEVYQMTFALFPLTRIHTEEGNI